MLRQGWILVGEVEKIWWRCSGLAHDPHGKLGFTTGQNQRRIMYCTYVSVY
jgi:hypothetical protein